VHGGHVLRHDRAERADGQLQRWVLLPDGLEFIDAARVAERNLQSCCERRADAV
jgi:hypothetical protein